MGKFSQGIASIQQYFNFKWTDYPVEYHIVNDVSTAEGDRYIQLTIPDKYIGKLAYTPRKNDILIFPHNYGTTQLKPELYWDIGITNSTYYNIPAPPLFLTQVDNGLFTFKPLTNLDEEFYTDYSYYSDSTDLMIGMGQVWSRLTYGNWRFNEYSWDGSKSTYVSPIRTDIKNRDRRESRTLIDAFKSFVKQLGDNFNLSLLYNPSDVSATDPSPWTLKGKSSQDSTDKLTTFYFNKDQIEITDFSERTRSFEGSANIVYPYGYQSMSYTTPLIKRNGVAKLLPSSYKYRFDRSPLVKMQSYGTADKDYPDVDQLLSQAIASIDLDTSYYDTEYSMSIRFPNVNFERLRRVEFMKSDTWSYNVFPRLKGQFRIIDNNKHVLNCMAREYNFETGEMIAGTNDDYTFNKTGA